MEIFENMVWGFCKWEVVALIFWAAATIWFLIDRHKLNKKIKEVRDQI